MLSAGDLAFFREITEAVLAASRVHPGAYVGHFGPNRTGGTLIRPGGRACYPAFWIRDFALSLPSGLITAEEQEHAFYLVAASQQRGTLRLPSGSIVPDGSIPDHITLKGVPIFFPGTIDDARMQGRPWGERPPADDHFYFIEMAWHLSGIIGVDHLMAQDVDGISVARRLERAFGAVQADEHTGLVFCGEVDRFVGFGFCDSVFQTGFLLFASLLRYRAALRLNALLGGAERGAEYGEKYGDGGRSYVEIARNIAHSVEAVFQTPSGMLASSTGFSAQVDVWGSAFASSLDILSESARSRVDVALAEAVQTGEICRDGQVRHVPVSGDWSRMTAWQRTVGDYAVNTYQNGAYWATPLGWLFNALSHVDTEVAESVATEYIRHLRKEDFRRGDAFGAPWECVHGEYRQNPVYLTSVTLPYAWISSYIRAGGVG